MLKSERDIREKQIVELVLQGENDAKIARKHSVSTERVRQIRIKNNLPNNFPSPEQKKIWTPELLANIEMLLDKGYTRFRISKELGITDGLVDSLMGRKGLKSRNIYTQNKSVPLSQYQKEVLVGCILGDAHIKKTKYGGKLTICQGMKQKFYVNHKFEIFKNTSIEKFDYRQTYLRGTMCESLAFSSLSTVEIGEFQKMFYKDRVKFIPDNIYDLLTGIGIAYWYMDDGNWHPDSYDFATDCFTKEDVQKLQFVLLDKYGIKSTSNNQRNRIQIPKGQKNFLPLVKPYILEEFKYKIREKK